MIIINLSETRKNVTIEVSGHGDDSDQSCARVSTVLDIITLFFSKLVSDHRKSMVILLLLLINGEQQNNSCLVTLYQFWGIF